jgi:hypothetical protein
MPSATTPIPTAIFIVIFARGKWWIDLNGKSQGPFITRETAVSEAIRYASEVERAGNRSEVQIAEPGQKSKIVFQSREQSLLGRGAALVNR